MTTLALSLPFRRSLSFHSMVFEAFALRPDSGIDDANDDVLGVVGSRPEAMGVVEREEGVRLGGVQRGFSVSVC